MWVCTGPREQKRRLQHSVRPLDVLSYRPQQLTLAKAEVVFAIVSQDIVATRVHFFDLQD